MLVRLSIEEEYRMDRKTVLRQWMEEHERGTGWIASKVDYSKQWISYVLNGHKPFSDKLARALQETIGIHFDDLPKAKQTTKRSRLSAKAAEPE